MDITNVVKRDGAEVAYERAKITQAITKAFNDTGEAGPEAAGQVSEAVEQKLQTVCLEEDNNQQHMKTRVCIEGKPSVEGIQDMVEKTLMEMDYFETAKSYILYRKQREQERQRSLFAKRRNLKPYQYPELAEYVDAIRHSYWVHTEFNYTGDIQDYKTNISESEKEVIKRAMLAIAQIEVAVKTFWGDVYKKMPIPEIGAVGFTFAESEVRHMDAYSHLIELLGLNDEFETLGDVPVIKERMHYLEQMIMLARTGENRDYAQSVLLFSLFIEHVSLFSQFLIIMSFNKYKNLFKGISNAVEATSKEEQIHGLFGIELINIIKAENPDWFDAGFEQSVNEMCQAALEVEGKIVDWIYEQGELDFLSKDLVIEFIKHRLNNSLERIGMKGLFPVDEALVEQTDWFDQEVIATKHVDFFNKRSINYNKRKQSITTDDLF